MFLLQVARCKYHPWTELSRCGEEVHVADYRL